MLDSELIQSHSSVMVYVIFMVLSAVLMTGVLRLLMVARYGVYRYEQLFMDADKYRIIQKALAERLYQELHNRPK